MHAVHTSNWQRVAHGVGWVEGTSMDWIPRAGGGVESSETDPMLQMDRAQGENHESAFKIENGFLGAKL